MANSEKDHRDHSFPKVDPSKSVFINCPFDEDYEQIFDAIIFSTICCGYIPRSTLETGNASESRFDRILNSLFSSKYSIHDLSRCKGEGDFLLARFNMPLELGMAMGLRSLCGKIPSEHGYPTDHEWLVLVPEGHLYSRFISDLAGFDPAKYDGSPEMAVKKVMSWLITRCNAGPTPRPSKVLTAFQLFKEEKYRLRDEWGKEVPWLKLLEAARDTVPSP